MLAKRRTASARNFIKDERKKELDAELLFALIFEYQYLYLLLTDRMVFQVADETLRRQIMNRLFDICIDSSVDRLCLGTNITPEQLRNRKILANDGLRRATNTYGTCKKTVPDKGEKEGGTMLWEFSLSAQKIIGYFPDIFVHAHLMLSMGVDIDQLNLRDFANAAKRHGK